MKTAYGVSLANRERKTEDQRDTLNYSVFLPRAKYFQAPGRSVRSQNHATPMTFQCATQLALQLKNQAETVTVVELLADDETFLPTCLQELTGGPVTPGESAALRNLKTAIEACFKDGWPQLDILSAVNKAVLNG
jgi:hypothetical protein